ncbi:MAG: hypothetical protein AVDCRST_MAG33-1627 [uncultured Thermomicrobiales bacterium]|uniref:Uncharacterized protein n=1 Tax=uncultured Thermomicrobiales bacterium TaxID=1645740 RepID=A0A6J4UU04_9BACT|nr:MAG: hypothetical protein AVDCRST_MAG33-1627 [uncultured Thermomicrobiales bacterium]
MSARRSNHPGVTVAHLRMDATLWKPSGIAPSIEQATSVSEARGIVR